MLSLHYTGDTILLADGVGAAVLRYARALAEKQSSDVAVIPFMQIDGTLGEAHLLLGPASQLYSTRAADIPSIPDDPAVIADLDERTRLLQPSTPLFADEIGAPPYPDLE